MPSTWSLFLLLSIFFEGPCLFLDKWHKNHPPTQIGPVCSLPRLPPTRHMGVTRTLMFTANPEPKEIGSSPFLYSLLNLKSAAPPPPATPEPLELLSCSTGPVELVKFNVFSSSEPSLFLNPLYPSNHPAAPIIYPNFLLGRFATRPLTLHNSDVEQAPLFNWFQLFYDQYLLPQALWKLTSQ